MATLHVRNVPDALYDRLRSKAEGQGRSLSAEVILLLGRALDAAPDQPAVLADIRRRRSFSPAAEGAPESAGRLRAMRDDAPAYRVAGEAMPDDELLAEARRVGQHATDQDALTAALSEYVTRQRQRAVLELFGIVDYDPEYDYKAQRRRS